MHCFEVYHMLRLIPARPADQVCQDLTSVKRAFLKFDLLSNDKSADVLVFQSI